MAEPSLLSVLHHLRCLVENSDDGRQSDRQLLERFQQQHDETAFAMLMRRHGRLVLSAIRRVLHEEADVEDVFQATFLVLLRKASSVRWQSSLGSWLFGVAHRIALKARANALQRQRRESEAGRQRPLAADEPTDLSWREALGLLHEELDRLPEKYRLPLLLCHLDGKSREEAAGALGCTVNTIKWRLERGRELLRTRLIRRGVTLSGALLAALVDAPAVRSVAPALIQATLNAARTGIYRSSVDVLMKAAAPALWMSKTRLTVGVILAVSLLAVGGGSILSPPSAPPESPATGLSARRPSPPARAQAKTKDTLVVNGRVLDPDGGPKAGAKLLLLDKERQIKQLGVSAADGQFTISIPSISRIKDRWHPDIFAQAEGVGIDFLSLAGRQPGHPVELRLVKDHPIRGRVVNTEGKPIRGVRVGVGFLGAFPNNSLDSFLIAWKKRRFNQGPLSGEKMLRFRGASLLTATTDAEGRFTIYGTGAERLTEIDLQGAGIARTRLLIVNRNGFDPKPYNQASLDNIPKGMQRIALRMSLHGPNVSIVAEPERVIRGTVTDADTGKELPNVVVRVEPNDDVAERRVSEARTDARGRYEFHGIPRAKAYQLQVPANPSTGYLACRNPIANNTAGFSPLTADIRLKKGVIVTGKVIDRTTGKSVPGVAKVGILFDNPFAKDYQRFGFSDSAGDYWAETAADGFFRIVTVPGPVVLMGRSDEDRTTGNFLDVLKYRLPIPDTQYPQYFSKSPDGVWTEYRSFFGSGKGIVDGSFCKVLDIKPGTAVVRQDIVLERASALEVKIQDASGRLLSGVWAADFASTRFTEPLWVEGSSCSVYSVEVRKPRLLVFYHPKKKIVGSRTLQGDEKAPLVVPLESTGAIKGRLLDTEDKPLAGVVVDAAYRHYAPQQVHQVMHQAEQVVTDANGAFSLDELIPKLPFDLSVRLGKKRFERDPKADKATIQVAPGACRDLGDIRMNPLRSPNRE